MGKKINFKTLAIYTGLILVGVFVGYLISTSAHRHIEPSAHQQIEKSENQIWTCAMHPQVRMDKPGKCPICGMDLIPLNMAGDLGTSPGEIEMTESALNLADVQTSIVKRVDPSKEIYLTGRVKPDERNITILTAHFPGRIENLFVNFTGQKVTKGEKLATIYSSELVTAQKELFETLKFKDSNPDYYQAARTKLKLWYLTDAQIDAIEKKGKPSFYFDVQAPFSGTVTKRHVALGDHVETGTNLFELVDLSHVWVLFDAYETDLPWIRVGDEISFEVQSIPGKRFSSKVTFIDPLVNPQTRVASVRTELNNPDRELKPDMFAKGIIKTNLPGVKNALIVPKTAVLWTGKRSVVYVKVPGKQHPTFAYREITLGEDAGNYYVVKDGLTEGEEIVTNGVFSVDAAAQLAGKKSMMNPEGENFKTEHHHGTTESVAPQTEDGRDIDKGQVPFEFKMQLGDVVDNYLALKNAFVASDSNTARKSANAMQSSLNKVNMELLSGDAHMAWMEAIGMINKALQDLINSQSLSKERQAFSDLSDALIHTLQVLGVELKTQENLYMQFCPMANNNKGGYWISEEKEIRNPYFGEAMLSCGETKQILK